MPYANNQGIRIHYELEGQGPPLVLHHGLGCSLEFWGIAGFVEPLKDDYQLILLDPRGHGASDKPHDPQAYKMLLRVADVVAVLDDLHISKARYCGYSAGGWVGWGIAKYAPERFSSLVIGGSSPDVDNAVFLSLFRQGMGAVLASFEQGFGPRWTPEVKAMFAANDLEALIACISAAGVEVLGTEDLLPTITVPCLLFGGELDPWFAGVQECARRMPNATFISLSGLGHVEALYRPDLVVPHMRKFLAEVSEG